MSTAYGARRLTRQQRRAIARHARKLAHRLDAPPTRREVAQFWKQQRPHRRFARWVQRLSRAALGYLATPVRAPHA